jgi:hypothetical protein
MWLEGLDKSKKFNYLIGTGTYDLLACTKLKLENHKRRDHLEILSVNGMIILKRIRNKLARDRLQK